ncbi:MAG: AcrR family transcriptional regulator [Pseudohongiellaceae bacterium]|jgi:AcrR family transcriptional regulator
MIRKIFLGSCQNGRASECFALNETASRFMPKKTKAATKQRVPLSKDRVFRAAVELADEIGIESLSMRRLGLSLGVEAMSLYKHVANKDDILDGIVEIVASEIEAPSVGGDWREAMSRRATSAHQVLLRHPWATMLIMSRGNVGPAMLRYVDATIGCLREAGFSYAAADHAWNAIDNHIYGFTLQKVNFPFEPEEYAEVAQSFLPMIPPEQYPYLNGLSQEVIAHRHDGLQDFSFGLKLILDGLERLL